MSHPLISQLIQAILDTKPIGDTDPIVALIDQLEQQLPGEEITLRSLDAKLDMILDEIRDRCNGCHAPGYNW